MARYILIDNASGYIWGDSVKIHLERLAQERGGDTTWETVYEEIAAETALGYLPHSSEIAGAVVFFASPLAIPAPYCGAVPSDFPNGKRKLSSDHWEPVHRTRSADLFPK